MKLDRDQLRTRRGIAGIVATVFMFAMLFTVGASYFLFVNQNNMLYSQAASARASVSSAQQNEDLVVAVETRALHMGRPTHRCCLKLKMEEKNSVTYERGECMLSRAGLSMGVWMTTVLSDLCTNYICKRRILHKSMNWSCEIGKNLEGL